MKITIWGTRGSIPAPITPTAIREKIYQAILGAQHLDISNPHAVRAYVDDLPPLLGGTAGGNTTCIEVKTSNETIIIDAGSGLRALGDKLMQGACGRGEGVVHLLFSHAHWDHVQGFPFFRPAFVPGNKIIIYSIHNMAEILTAQQRFVNFPVPFAAMPAEKIFHPFPLDDGIFIDGVKISAIKNMHPGDAYSFRFEDSNGIFVHASDAEYKTLDRSTLKPYINFFKNADVLIFDAQFTLQEALAKEDWGHSSALIGIDIARRAAIKKLVLFHHDPSHNDDQLQKILDVALEYQAQDASYGNFNVVVAHEGMMFDLDNSPQQARIQTLADSDVTILTPPNILDEQTIEDLQNDLANLEKRQGWPRQMIIDFAAVETLTIAGLTALVGLKRRQDETSVFLAGVSNHIQKVFKLAGFANLFAFYPSTSDALAALRNRNAMELTDQIIKQRYRLEEEIGRGLRGTVFRGTDLQLKQTVAVKILPPSLNTRNLDNLFAQAEQLIGLQHRNIVQVFSLDEENGVPFIIEAFINASTLEDLLRNAAKIKIPLAQKWDIALQMSLALAYAHQKQVLHGSLKPQNVILADQVKVSDFSLYRLYDEQNLLNAPFLMAAVDYLAPEQILGRQLSPQTDLYALGVILYELFTERHPFGGTDREIMMAHLHKTPLSPRRLSANISHALENLIVKLLAKDPANRYSSAEEVRHLLESIRNQT